MEETGSTVPKGHARGLYGNYKPEVMLRDGTSSEMNTSHLGSCLRQPTESFGGGTDGFTELGQFAVLGVLGDAGHGLAQHLQDAPYISYGDHLLLPQRSQAQSSLCFTNRGGITFPFAPTTFPNLPYPSPNLHFWLRAHLGVLHDAVKAVKVGHVIDGLGGVLQ